MIYIPITLILILKLVRSVDVSSETRVGGHSSDCQMGGRNMWYTLAHAHTHHSLIHWSNLHCNWPICFRLWGTQNTWRQTRRKGGGGSRRRQWWEVNTIAPPEADKLLNSDCCWPPVTAVNSCIILFLRSSFLLPLLFLFFLSAPSTLLLCRALRLSLCVRRALMRACFGPWREWSAPWHRCFRAHTHTHTMQVCRTTRSPFAPRACDVCWGVRVSIGSSPA